MLGETAGQHCSHIRADQSKPCPFLCQSWLNSFPWDKSNARFDKTDIFANFLKTVQNLSVGDIFDSVDFVYDQKLNSIADAARSSVDDPSSDNSWKQRLVDNVQKLESLPTLNAKQFAIFKQLVTEKLAPNINSNKTRVIPNALIMSTEEDEEKLNIKMVLNNHRKKKKVLTAQDFASMHEAFPELKSITSKDIHFKFDKYEDVKVNNNSLESLDITLGNSVNSPSGLLTFLFRSYHETIKSLKLEMPSDKPLASLEAKRDKVDQGSLIKRVFRENELKFHNLEVLEINNFLNWIDIDVVLRKLGRTSCKLKSVKFLGQQNAEAVFSRMTKDHYQSLESLALSTQDYKDIGLLSNLKALKQLSYLWNKPEEKVDILKVLMVLPNLKSLELGHEKRQGDLVSNVVNFDIYNLLNRLSLSHVHIEGDEFEKLSSQLPNLKNIVLTGCRIGKSRTDTESTISFGNYTLDTLLIEDCKLFYSIKEKKSEKRVISRFMLAMDSPEPYVAAIRSSINDKSKNGKLYIERKFFVYDVATNENETLATNTLLIKANLIRSFSVSKNSPVHVALCPESEIENEDDSSESSATEAETEDDEETKEVEDVEETEVEEGEEADEVEMIEAEENEEVEVEASEEANEVEMIEAEENEEAEIEETKEADEVEMIETEENEEAEVEETEEADEVEMIETEVNEEAEEIVADKDKEVTELVEVEPKETIVQIEIEDDDSEEVNNDSEVDEVRAVSETKTLENDDSSLPEIPESPVHAQKEIEKVDSSDYGSEAESVDQYGYESAEDKNEMVECLNDIIVDQITPEVTKYGTSEYESDDDEPVVVIKAMVNRSLRKKENSDEDYLTPDIVTSNSSESEFDDDMGTFRRSSRIIPRKSLQRPVKAKLESRKRPRVLFFSSEEEEEEYDENNLISQFVRNCKKYNAVIRIPPKKRSKYKSPSL